MVKKAVDSLAEGPKTVDDPSDSKTASEEDDADPQAKQQGSLKLLVVGVVALLACVMIVIGLMQRSSVSIPPAAAAGEAALRGSAAAGGALSAEKTPPRAQQPFEGKPPPQLAQNEQAVGAIANPVAVFNTTMGVFTAEIFLDRVPITASNFIDLSRTGFYDGLHFHRVIKKFMAQFGCPFSKDPKSRRAGTGGPKDGTFKNLKTGAMEKREHGGNIKDEFISKDPNVEGTLSMANTGRPDSGGSQIFINVANNNFLNWFTSGQSRHPVFGKVLKGYDIVKAITEVRTKSDNPLEPIKMNSITIEGI
mmetsp:Transcript_44461/g.105360  ORF Transcript_44461/g.105360 Transcript_44461/m.105360 type:complete len:307 (-) Transcript_44461:72-992(-)